MLNIMTLRAGGSIQRTIGDYHNRKCGNHVVDGPDRVLPHWFLKAKVFPLKWISSPFIQKHRLTFTALSFRAQCRLFGRVLGLVCRLP